MHSCSADAFYLQKVGFYHIKKYDLQQLFQYYGFFQIKIQTEGHITE